MKKNILIGIGLCLVIWGAYKFVYLKFVDQSDDFETVTTQQILAVYATNDSNVTNLTDSILHFNLSWTNPLAKCLPVKQIIALKERGLPLFINLQIFPAAALPGYKDDITKGITEGKYDDKLAALFTLLQAHNNTVYIRYNGDMEVPATKYSWQFKSFNTYIASFRHIATIAKQTSPSLKMVWGPSGYPGAEEYWPGDEFFDYCSINLTKEKEASPNPYPPYASVEEMISRKTFRMRFSRKPILLLGSATVGKKDFNPAFLDTLKQAAMADSAIYFPVATINDPTLNVEKKPLVIGVFDPQSLLVNQPQLTTEHLFANFSEISSGNFEKELKAVLKRNHSAIVTFEMWKDKKLEKDPQLLLHVLSGKYDSTIKKVYELISNVPQTIYLRWGHEMEIPITRYPWQQQDPVTYIKAYRYVANFEKNRASNIKLVWGPAGDRGSVEFWPGADVVDYVSIAIYGLPDKNINDHTKQHSFSSIFNVKSHRIRFAGKPIFITECGVKGPEAYKKNWLEDAANTLNKNSNVIGINYFSFKDSPKAWGDAEIPDWSITPATFKSFVSKLTNAPMQK